MGERIEYSLQFRSKADPRWKEFAIEKYLDEAEEEYKKSLAEDKKFDTETRLVERVISEEVIKP